jgi:putative hydrolase of the HAD superfamily
MGSALLIGGTRVDAEAVVFDLFHTLVDPQAHAAPGFRRLEAVASILELPILDVELWWEQAVDRLVSTPDSPIDALVDLARSRRIVLSPAAVAALDRAMGAAADAALGDPIDGVIGALVGLRDAGVRIGILSNALVRDVRSFPESPLAPLVDEARMSCFTGMVKPDAGAYAEVLQRLGAPAERSVYVGDGGSDELAGAKSVGFGTVVAVTGAVESGGWRPQTEQQRIVAQADIAVTGVAEIGSA